MSLRPAPTKMRPVVSAAFFLLLAVRVMAAPTGPTLHFDYGAGKSAGNPLVKFMYCVLLCM